MPTRRLKYTEAVISEANERPSVMASSSLLARLAILTPSALKMRIAQKAREGKIDPVIGRKKEIDKIIQVLSRRTKNNPVLIGEAIVGRHYCKQHMFGTCQTVVAVNIYRKLQRAFKQAQRQQTNGQKSSKESKGASALDKSVLQYGTDLTQKAREGSLKLRRRPLFDEFRL